MAMNLRENKMDRFDDSKKKKSFFSFGESRKKLMQGESVSRLGGPAQQKALDTADHASQRRAWVRKEEHEQKDVITADYQENYHYETEYSRFIKDNPDHVIVSWRGPEFEHYPHDRRWYMGALLIICLIIVYAIFTDSIVMAIVFVLIAFTGYLFLSRPQKVIDFAITYDGIVIGNEIYAYDAIKSFWIFYEPPHTRIISLHMRDHFRPHLHIPLHQVDPVVIHRELTQFIPEIKQDQSFIDIFERLLRM